MHRVQPHPPRLAPSPSLSHLLQVDLERPGGLALGARARLHLLLLTLVKRPEHEAALEAVELEHAELRQDARGAGDHAARAYELAKVQLPQRAELLHEGQLRDADVDHRGDAVVVGEVREDDVPGCLRKEGGGTCTCRQREREREGRNNSIVHPYTTALLPHFFIYDTHFG